MSNNIVRVGLAAAAVVVIAIIAIYLLPGTPPPGGPTDSPTPSVESTPEPSLAAVSVWDDAPGVGSITVTLPGPGWQVDRANHIVFAPGYEDVAMLVFAGDLWIYEDPCAWSTTTPDTPATTVDGIVDALASQASRDASEPRDYQLRWYILTLHVPDDAEGTASDRFRFTGCDQEYFGTLAEDNGGAPHPTPSRYHQGPGQIDEFWVDGQEMGSGGGTPVVFDLSYWPDTPQEVIDDLRAMVESATFGE